ncbi:hypothetical protein [uncultured Arcobacter sp.]|uniref:hypothetical protein n=1 Tax=uncultured Arcobacter sp. TaxID=165434 RepID=UPI0026063F72|nr:hypothetical protein [uncultured Arcobacter sp.]
MKTCPFNDHKECVDTCMFYEIIEEQVIKGDNTGGQVMKMVKKPKCMIFIRK